MGTDDEGIKRKQRRDWDHAAPYWRRYDEHVRRNSVEATRRMLELAQIEAGQRVLDVASGTGEPGLPAAERVGPSGFVLLSDMSEEMLAVARDKAQKQGLRNVGFRVSDTEALELDPESFDAALCRCGLCLMPQPVRCLGVIHDALKPGGRISVLVLGRPEANPYFVIPFAILSKYATLPPYDPTLPGPFALADPEKLRSVLTEAGFHQVQVERMAHTWRLDSGRQYWDYMRFSPVAAALEEIPPDQHAKIGDEIAAAAASGDPDGVVELPGEFVLAVGVR